MLGGMTGSESIRGRLGAAWAFGAIFAGLGFAACGLIVQWIAAPETFAGFGFPPGFLYIIVAGLIVWVDRHSVWSPAAAVGLALWIVVGGLAGGVLIPNLTSDDLGVVLGNVVMTVGLVLASVAGGIAIVHNRRHQPGAQVKPLSIRNPRRTVMVVLVVALVAVAVGDAAPEGLQWDGPGPVLFLALALLVALVPGRSMVLLAVLMSVAFVVGAVQSPEAISRLSAPSEVLGFGSTVLQILGLAVSVVAGAVAVLPERLGRADRDDRDDRDEGVLHSRRSG